MIMIEETFRNIKLRFKNQKHKENVDNLINHLNLIDERLTLHTENLQDSLRKERHSREWLEKLAKKKATLNKELRKQIMEHKS